MPFFAVSCVDDLVDPGTDIEQKETVTITVHSNAQTKTILVDDKHVRWEEGDIIDINNELYPIRLDENNPEIAYVDNVTAANEYFAHYSSAWYYYQEDGVIFELPTVQRYRENSFDAFTNQMIAYGTSTDLYFYNAASILKLGITGNGESIKSVTVASNNGEPMSGYYLVPFGDFENLKEYKGFENDSLYTKRTYVQLNIYDEVKLSGTPQYVYFVVPPQTYEGGFTVAVEDAEGRICHQSTSKSITTKRSDILQMAEFTFKASEAIAITDVTPGQTNVNYTVTSSPGQRAGHAVVSKVLWDKYMEIYGEGYESVVAKTLLAKCGSSITPDSGAESFIAGYTVNYNDFVLTLTADTEYKILASYAVAPSVGAVVVKDFKTLEGTGTAPSLKVNVDAGTDYVNMQLFVSDDATSIVWYRDVKSFTDSVIDSGLTLTEIANLWGGSNYGQSLDMAKSDDGAAFNLTDLEPETEYSNIFLITTATGAQTVRRIDVKTTNEFGVEGEWNLYSETSSMTCGLLEPFGIADMFLPALKVEKLGSYDIFRIHDLNEAINLAFDPAGTQKVFDEFDETQYFYIDARDTSAVVLPYDKNHMYMGGGDICYFSTADISSNYYYGTYSPSTGAIALGDLAMYYFGEGPYVVGNTSALYLGERPAAPEYKISELKDLGDYTRVRVKGNVVATYARGFVISDGTDNLLIYEGPQSSGQQIGSSVEVTAMKTTYRGQVEMTDIEKIDVTGTVEVTYPEPVVFTADNIGGIVDMSTVYCQITGTIQADGTYLNIAIDGTDIINRIEFPHEADREVLVANLGASVKVKGYYIGRWDLNTGSFRTATVLTSLEIIGTAPVDNKISNLSAKILAGVSEYEIDLNDAVVTYVNGRNAFIEDTSGAILLYVSNHGLVAGNRINGRVSGTSKIYNGLPELTSMDMSAAVVTSGAEIPCTEVTIAELLSNYNSYLSRRVILRNVTVTDGLNLADDRNGAIYQDGYEIDLYSQNISSVVMKNGSTGNLICYPSYYKTTRQLTVWQLEDYYVTTEGIYESTDFSQDGLVYTLQEATEGNGIDIVLLGDGYSDRQIADGTYRKVMEDALEYLFVEEPYKSFRHLFNVYMVNAVSLNEGIGVGSTVFSTYFGEGTYVGGDDNKVFAYAMQAIPDTHMDKAMIVVMQNSTNYAGTCWMYGPESGDYGNGLSISYFPVGSDGEAFKQVLNHEACGHGFSKLDDEYAYEYMGAITAEDIESRKSIEPYGWWKNTDTTSDPAQVKWAHFLTDDRYANDGLGVFEGASTYWTGVWRSTDNSIMRYNTGGFNAPSREAIYYRIHKLAYGDGWVYDYEDFVEYDAINRTQAAMAKRRAQSARQNLNDFKPLAPPVVVGKTWREAMND